MDDGLRGGRGGVVLTLEITVSDRFRKAVEAWADARMTDEAGAMATKAEQSLLEIEHLVSQSHDVEFEVNGDTIVYEPTEELTALLERQAAGTDLDESDVLKLHVDLFANAFLEEASEEERPPNAPPTE